MKTQDFLNLSDLEHHPSLIDVYFKNISLTKYLKRHHAISGWYNISGILPDGRIDPMFDIWCGFNDEYLIDITKIIIIFCQLKGIEFK